MHPKSRAFVSFAVFGKGVFPYHHHVPSLSSRCPEVEKLFLKVYSVLCRMAHVDGDYTFYNLSSLLPTIQAASQNFKAYPWLIAPGKKVFKSFWVYKKTRRNAKDDDEQTRIAMSSEWF